MGTPEAFKRQADAFAREWTEAWNSHDVDRIVSHYADELHYVSPLIYNRFPELDGVITDRETLRQYVSMGLEKRPDLAFTLLGVLYSARGFVMFYENAFGTHSAEYIELGADNRATLSIACYSDEKLPLP